MSAPRSRIGHYTPGEYERAVTACSRAYADGEMNVTEFRQLLAMLRKSFNRVPSPEKVA